MNKRIGFLCLLMMVLIGEGHAQLLSFCVDHHKGPWGTDTALLYVRSTADTTVGIRAVNFSFAFHDSCADFIAIDSSVFQGAWGFFFERTVVTDSHTLVYDSVTYTSRVQYGNSDPGIGGDTAIWAPPDTAERMLVMKLVFGGSCVKNIYMESEAENFINQIGDVQFFPIPFDIVSCKPPPDTMPIDTMPPMALDQVNGNFPIQVFPQPTRDFLTIQWPYAHGLSADILLYSLQGKLILKEKAFRGKGKMDVRGLPAGMYLLGVKGNRTGRVMWRRVMLF